MIRYFAPIIGLLGTLAPVLAHAQTNLDQGKSASQIFASACAECHKSAHGLSHGRNSSALVDFLGEHYTTNRDQAAALAAYVLGGSGAAPIGATPQGRGQKPKTEHAGVATEEAKPSKPMPKRAARSEDGKPESTKLRRPTHEAAKPKNDSAPSEQPSIAAPEPGQPPRSATANRSGRKEMKVQPPPASPEPVVEHAPAVEPASTETPAQETSPAPAPSETAPTNAASGESGEGAPVPRDNIPD